MEAPIQPEKSQITFRVVLESYSELPAPDELETIISQALYKAGYRSTITIEPPNPDLRPMIF